jgi:hypothetical protein
MNGKRGKKVLRLIFAPSGGGNIVTSSAPQDAYCDNTIPVEDRVCADTKEGVRTQVEKADTRRHY